MFFRGESFSQCALIALLVMVGCNSAFRGLIKKDSQRIAFTHCMLHRHTLVSKTLLYSKFLL